MGGILASISEAAIRVAIQAHLLEEGGRKREGRREEREQIYERKGRGACVCVACSQCVTEIERFHERERDTETERENTKQGWGPNTEIEVAGKTEICTQT